ncbi:MAG: peptide ABC transporter substrate-binding protein [Parvularculaceae bacterium]
MRRSSAAYPATLDPHLVTTTWERDIIAEMFEGLMTLSAAGKPAPGAASEYAVSEDGLTYTFKLRNGLVWSDGEPLTAEDFVYSFRRALNPVTASPYASILFPLLNGEDISLGRAPPTSLGVSAIDPETVEIRLESPTPYFLDLLTHMSASPTPRHAIERYGADWTDPAHIVVNGPFILSGLREGRELTLRRNANFHESASVYFDSVVYLVIEDAEASLYRFTSGELDLAQGRSAYPSDKAAAIDAVMPWARRDEILLSLDFIAANTSRPPFDDPRLRRALSLSIDREALASLNGSAGGAPAWSFAPPGVANYVSEPPMLAARALTHEARIQRAKELLAAAGFDDATPLALTFISRAVPSDPNPVAGAIADMWRGIGVRVELQLLGPRAAYAAYEAGEFEVGDAGWRADYDDPQTFLLPATASDGALNFSRYENPEVEALMAEAANTVDLERRAIIIAQAEAILLSELPLIPILHGFNRNLVAAHIVGWEPNPKGAHLSRYLSVHELPNGATATR